MKFFAVINLASRNSALKSFDKFSSCVHLVRQRARRQNFADPFVQIGKDSKVLLRSFPEAKNSMLPRRTGKILHCRIKAK
nr:hypothetical protein [uncultured Campylobacter sp.]